jgi:hypothetical protein
MDPYTSSSPRFPRFITKIIILLGAEGCAFYSSSKHITGYNWLLC